MQVYYKYQHINGSTNAVTLRNGFVRSYATVEEMNDPTLIGALAVKDENGQTAYVGVGPFNTGFASQGLSRSGFHVMLDGGVKGTVRYLSKFYLIQLELTTELDYFTIPAESGYIEGFVQAIAGGYGGQGGGGGSSGISRSNFLINNHTVSGCGGSSGIFVNSSSVNGSPSNIIPGIGQFAETKWFRLERGYISYNLDGSVNSGMTNIMILPGYEYRCIPGNGGSGGTAGPGAAGVARATSSSGVVSGGDGGHASTSSGNVPAPQNTIFERRLIGSGIWTGFGVPSSSPSSANFGPIIPPTERTFRSPTDSNTQSGLAGGTSGPADGGVGSSTDFNDLLREGGPGGISIPSNNRNGRGGNGGQGGRNMTDWTTSEAGLAGETGHTGQLGYGTVDLKVWI